MSRPIFVAFALVGLAGSLLLPRLPAPLTATKIAWLASVAVLWGAFTGLAWGKLKVRVLLLALPLIVALAFAVPGRPLNASALRDDYARSLLAYEGTPYVWGGESRRGIDCSGLPRRAWREALLRYGVRHANSRALRLAATQWWYDASARSLASGHRGTTRSLGYSGRLDSLDPTRLQPGDLAVTTSGLHLLVSLGGTRWIQADPGTGSVITFDSRTSHNGWLQSEVTLHRWQVLHQDSID